MNTIGRYRTLVSYNLNKRNISTTNSLDKSFRKWYRELWQPKPIHNPPYGHFTQIGDPVLREKASLVPEDFINSKEIDLVIEQMIKVMRKFDCVGIAAPQIGVSLRIIAMEFRKELKDELSKPMYEARQMQTLPLTVFVNPVLTVKNYQKLKHPEGCMSVKGFSADVERYEAVSLSGVGKMGTPSQVELKGWNARIAQHEVDHLNGKLYTDIMDPSTFKCTCWETVNTKGGRVEIPFYE